MRSFVRPVTREPRSPNHGGAICRSLEECSGPFATTPPASIYRKFVNPPGGIEISHGGIGVHFDPDVHRESHNPILKEAGLNRPTPPIPWCHNLPLQRAFP